MPNTLDQNGLTVKTDAEILDDLQKGMRAAYGDDINLASNSPDGQMIGLFKQAVLDLLGLILDVYNSFSIANAYGAVLHARVALNGIFPKIGTYTTTPVNVTVDRALTLQGLDALITDPAALVYTLRDSTTQWQLTSTYAFGGGGTQALVFEAVPIGPVTPLPNTITNQVTPIVGVTAVNNPTIAGAVIGLPEESDPALKVRHGRSFMLAATGPADSITAALLSLEDMKDAYVLENITGSEDDNGVPAHGIWVITRGSSTDVAIGTAIYSKKSIGSDMKGAKTYVVSRPGGLSFTSKWDEAAPEQLFAKFTVTPRVPGLEFDIVLLAQEVAAALSNYLINQQATIGDLIVAMNTIEPRAILSEVGVSDDGIAYDDTLSPTAPKNYFTLAAGDINITQS